MPVSYWVDSTPEADFARLEGDLSVDVAVLGAGITGLTAALLLKRAGKSVALLHEHLGVAALTVEQGVEMGRPSRLDCAWEDDRPRVSGAVVVVADGHVLLGDGGAG